MSKVECDHIKYCSNCDRYFCVECGCACMRGKGLSKEEIEKILSESNAEISDLLTADAPTEGEK